MMAAVIVLVIVMVFEVVVLVLVVVMLFSEVVLVMEVAKLVVKLVVVAMVFVVVSGRVGFDGYGGDKGVARGGPGVPVTSPTLCRPFFKETTYSIPWRKRHDDNV